LGEFLHTGWGIGDKKLEISLYRMMQKVFRYVKPFMRDRQTDEHRRQHKAELHLWAYTLSYRRAVPLTGC